MNIFKNNFIPIMLGSFLVTSAFMSTAAPAQMIKGHNSRAPISVDGGFIQLQDRADRVVLDGGVIVSQAGLTIRATRVTAAYSDNGGIDVNRIDAAGGVTITKDDLRATSNAAIYDLKSDLITLIGNVNLNQGGNKLNGGRLVIDLNAGNTTLSGGGTLGNNASNADGVSNRNDGRVRGTFTVPQRKN